MTQITLPGGEKAPHHELTVKAALKRAWIAWTTLLIAPFLFLQAAIWYMDSKAAAPLHADTQAWFIGAMGYLVLVVPAMFFWRKHLFREYWLGKPVEPGKYIAATVTAGVALAIGGIISLIGCLVTNQYMPNLIPGFMALVLFVLHWPTGKAMLKGCGHEVDEAHYEEPR